MSNVILVGVDGREHSRDAVALGAALAGATGARVVLGDRVAKLDGVTVRHAA